jgi:CheY-like chemotaxis protein
MPARHLLCLDPMMSVPLSEPEHIWEEQGDDPLPSLEGIRVLVVDDDDEAREAITAVLEESGAGVVSVASAPEALQSLEHAQPDVLLSDISMPGMDGHTLIRQVRSLGGARGGGTPAVALTAFASSTDRTRALLAGFQLYLAKPFEPAELVTLIASLAGRV